MNIFYDFYLMFIVVVFCLSLISLLAILKYLNTILLPIIIAFGLGYIFFKKKKKKLLIDLIVFHVFALCSFAALEFKIDIKFNDLNIWACGFALLAAFTFVVFFCHLVIDIKNNKKKLTK